MSRFIHAILDLIKTFLNFFFIYFGFHLPKQIMLLLSGAKFLKLSFKFCFKKTLQVIHQCCLGQRGNLLISQSPKSFFQA